MVNGYFAASASFDIKKFTRFFVPSNQKDVQLAIHIIHVRMKQDKIKATNKTMILSIDHRMLHGLLHIEIQQLQSSFCLVHPNQYVK